MDILVALLAGLIVGLVVGGLGAGGGILAIPILVYVLGHAPHNAGAESLIIVGVTALIALLGRRQDVHVKDGLIFSGLAIAGSVLGSRLALLTDPNLLMVLFGCLLIGVSIIMYRRSTRSRRPEPAASVLVLIVAASITGLLTGFFGVGGGFAVVPLLVVALGFSMREAAATSLLVMIIMSITGLLSRVGGVDIDIPVIAVFTVMSMAGGVAGERLTRSIADQVLIRIFAGLLLVMAVVTLGISAPKLF